MILITGANGRLGSYVCKLLSKNGMKLKLMSLIRMHRLKNSSVVYSNLFDKDSLLMACENVDTIVHLAGTVDYTLPAKDIMQINYNGTKNVIDAALKSGVSKIVYASSTSVYGNQKELPITEDSKLKSKESYGLSKIKAEEAITKSGIGYTILRPTVIYGKGFDAGFSSILKLMKSDKMKILGNGKNRLHFVHAKDCAQAFYLAARADAFNDTFNIAGPEVITQEEALKMIANHIKMDPPVQKVSRRLTMLVAKLSYTAARIRRRVPSVLPEYIKVISSDRCYSIAKARNMLNYKPVIDYKKGLKDALSSVDV